MSLIAKQTETFIGSLLEVSTLIHGKQNNGYEIDTVIRFRTWPKFWKFVYIVTISKPVLIKLQIICDSAEAINQIDEIKQSLKNFK